MSTGVMYSSLGYAERNVNLWHIVLWTDFAFKLLEPLRHSWQMFILMLDKKCLV